MIAVPRHNLRTFLEDVSERVESRFDDPRFDATQRELLRATLDVYVKESRRNPTNNLLTIFYLAARAWHRELDEQSELLAAFCLLYVLAADLIDDVQDDDLVGKPHEKAGPAIAINTGLTLLFLGLDVLREAMLMEPDPDRSLGYLELFNQTSLLAVSGQHRDLLGAAATPTPEDVLAMQQAKTSSLAMIAECAVLFAGCDERTISHYRRASEKMVQIAQVVDDVRDVFGKKFSPDIATNKMTHPMACFMETADREQLARYESLVKALPGSLKEIRVLLYESGAIEKSAEAIERLRVGFHEDIAATGNGSPAHRTWLHLIDTLAGTVYTVRPVASTGFIQQPDGEWHRRVQQMAERFVANVATFDPPEIPPLLPWHLSQWMYDPKRKVIFYPDLEGQAEEAVAAEAGLMGTNDLEHVRDALEVQSPVVMVHELFHYWRDVSGNFTRDAWFEEWAAVRLALAYARVYEIERLSSVRVLADHILELHPDGIGDHGQKILKRFFEPGYVPQENTVGYEVGLEEMALIQLDMVRRLQDEDASSLAEAVSELLPK